MKGVFAGTSRVSVSKAMPWALISSVTDSPGAWPGAGSPLVVGAGVGVGGGGVSCSVSQALNPSRDSTLTSNSIAWCRRPQNWVHWPRKVPSRSARNWITWSLRGVMSRW